MVWCWFLCLIYYFFDFDLNLNVEILCGENLCLNNSICFFMFNIVFCCCIKGMFKVLYCFFIGKIIFIGIIYYNLFIKC